jgi:predicted Rossmann fold flavoprotein
MQRIVIIGGGAAGFFAAVNCAEQYRQHEVIILEKSSRVLDKVRVSGGGRCNVTHACWIPRDLIKNYPRGSRELLSVFSRFQPSDTIDWFEQRGVELKVEDDGRMFPTTDNSQTIIDCLTTAAHKAGVKIWYKHAVEQLLPPTEKRPFWDILLHDGNKIAAHKIMVATGSSPAVWRMLATLGHTIVPPVPSLFTFHINDPRLTGLEGISMPMVTATLASAKLHTEGAALITHWGLSGPAILKLSAWAARLMHAQNYHLPIQINWTWTYTPAECEAYLTDLRTDPNSLRKQITTYPLFDIPARLWRRLLTAANLPETLRWADIANKQIAALAAQLTQSTFNVKGKSTFKDEFVTCGGVSLTEINFKTMESKLHKGLYFGGEVLDVDAVTGGFNFQAAWSTAWIAAGEMGVF